MLPSPNSPHGLLDGILLKNILREETAPSTCGPYPEGSPILSGTRRILGGTSVFLYNKSPSPLDAGADVVMTSRLGRTTRSDVV